MYSRQFRGHRWWNWRSYEGLENRKNHHILKGKYSSFPRKNDVRQLIFLEQFTFTLQFTYILVLTLIKLSVLLLHKRIFVTPNFGKAIKIMCISVVMWFITFFFATLLQSIPISNNWNVVGSRVTDFQQLEDCW